jgi:hypothetical protein
MKYDTIYLLLLYILTLILILNFKENEYNILIILLLSLFVLILKYKINILLVITLAFLFCIVEYICVKYNIWFYNYTNNTLPIWLFFAWILAIIFILELNKIFNRNNYYLLIFNN